MLSVIALIAESSEATTIKTVSGWWLLVPFAILLLPFVIGIGFSWRYWKSLKWLMGEHSSARGLVAVLPALIFAVVVPAFLDRPLTDDILHHKIREGYTLNLSMVAGALAIFAWSQFVTFWLSDAAIEDARVDRQILDETRRYATFHLGIARSFLAVVALKAERVESALARLNGGKTTLGLLRSALNPAKQKEGLITAVHTIFNNRVDSGHRVRVTYFELDGSYLTPRLQNDGQLHRKFGYFSDVKDRFRVNVRPASVAAAAAVHNEFVIVPDAEKAHKDPDHPFFRLRAREEEGIESIVAIPLPGDGETLPAKRVITIDTDKPGFFEDTSEMRNQLALLAENIKERLLYEASMAKLLDCC